MAHIDFYYSLISPFTYMAGDRPVQIATKHGATITHRPCDLMNVFSKTGGVPVPQRAPARQEYRLQELPRLARRAGVPLTLHPKHWPVDATTAMLSVIAVDALGGAPSPISLAFLRACWAEERDISDPGTIDEILTSLGHPVAGDLDLDAARQVYDANTQMALENGVFGAPFFVVDGTERFWGQDRLDYLDDYLRSEP